MTDQERIKELLREWASLDTNAAHYDEICGIAAHVKRPSGLVMVWWEDSLYNDDSELVIQAAIREGCEARNYQWGTRSNAERQGINRLWYFDVKDSEGHYLYGAFASNLTLAMLECWIEVLKAEKGIHAIEEAEIGEKK